MPIAREVVLHVAELASLSLEEGEVDELARELDAIVRYVELLGAVDTVGVLPATSGAPRAAGQKGAWRADAPEPSLPRDDALAQAPAVEDGAFVVPLFVDGSAEGGTSRSPTRS
jgi:aspartyl-tRNA(Asn)/glutamyl-tRNA(Gln) amidotransferase subunit C